MKKIFKILIGAAAVSAGAKVAKKVLNKKKEKKYTDITENVEERHYTVIDISDAKRKLSEADDKTSDTITSEKE